MSQQAKLSLSTKDVIHIEGFQENASLFKNESTLRIRTILQQLQAACTSSGMGLAEVNALMEQGIPCEVLQPGASDWQMGSIRLSLEFQPGPASAAPMDSVAVAAAATQMDFGDEMASIDDLDETFDEDLDMAGLDDLSLNDVSIDGNALSEMMPDASLEESVNSDLDLSGLSDMNGLGHELSDGLGDDLGSDHLSFDLDSQAVDADDLGGLGDLSSPWDLNDDLDEMMLTNGSL